MEYVQERVATLHDLTGAAPDAPVDRAAVVVPMTEREPGGAAAERVFAALERVDPARVIVPLRAPAGRVDRFRRWLSGFDLSLTVLWCSGPRVADRLAAVGLGGDRGKGRDVWLGLGQALDAEYVVVHDADAASYDDSYVPRLLFPLARGRAFSKGYYARVEDDRIYGRLFRLFYAPLVRALRERHDADVLEYLGAFRYALAGEFAATGELVGRLRVQPTWGLEVGTLGEAFAHAGFDGSAQVDLGVYEHDHRAVEGSGGLSEMSRAVGAALLRAVEEHGVDPDYAALSERYGEAANDLIENYALDAAFNGLSYGRREERAQVRAYADSIAPPGPDARYPAWEDAPLSPSAIRDAAAADLEAAG